MICRNCGQDINYNETICFNCNQHIKLEYIKGNSKYKDILGRDIDKDRLGLGTIIIATLMPGFGFIMWLLWKERRPNSALYILGWSIIILIIGFIFRILSFLINLF